MKFTPHEYQRHCIQQILEKPKVGLFLDMGLGKTIISLAAIRILEYDQLAVDKCLIIAPKTVAQGTWSREAQKWDETKDLRISVVLGTEKQRKEELAADADVYVINRENVVWLKEYFRNEWPFDMVVVDEASSFKSHTAKRFKALAALSDHIKRMVILTGTPTPNGMLDLWSQVYLLDQGERLQKRFTWFRDIYFEPNIRGAYGQIFSYRIKPGSEDTILSKIKDICISMQAKDYLQLPEMIIDDVPVVLDPTAKKKYLEMEKQMVLQLPDDDQEITALSAAALSTKLLQLSNGAVYDEDGSWHEIHTCKIDAAMELIEALKERGEQVLVFYMFKHDKERLLKRLNDTPRMTTYTLEDDEDVVAWNMHEMDVLLAHPASTAYGLNLQQGGRHIIWMSPTWNYEQYVQANARLHRQGQEKPVIVHRLIGEGTRDTDVVRALEKKDDAQQYVLDSLKARIKEIREGTHGKEKDNDPGPAKAADR